MWKIGNIGSSVRYLFGPYCPLFIWLFLISTGNLGTNPQEFIERYLGTCTLVLLLVAYSISVRVNRAIPHLINCRRMVGLFSFVYMTCHFFAYIIFEHSFVMADFFKDFSNRPFVFWNACLSYDNPIGFNIQQLKHEDFREMVEKTSFHDNGNNSVIAGPLLFSQGREKRFFLAIYCDCSICYLVCCKKVELFRSKKKLNPNFACGRGERIRTSGFCVPNTALYLTELHPANHQPFLL